MTTDSLMLLKPKFLILDQKPENHLVQEIPLMHLIFKSLVLAGKQPTQTEAATTKLCKALTQAIPDL